MTSPQPISTVGSQPVTGISTAMPGGASAAGDSFAQLLAQVERSVQNSAASLGSGNSGIAGLLALQAQSAISPTLLPGTTPSANAGLSMLSSLGGGAFNPLLLGMNGGLGMGSSLLGGGLGSLFGGSGDSSDSSNDGLAQALSLAGQPNLSPNLLSALGGGGLLGGQSAGLQNVLTMALLGVVKELLSATGGSAAAADQSQAQGPLWPVQGPVTQAYHEGHSGVDIGVPIDTPVQATMPGKVIYAGWNTEGYGNLVILQNGDYETYYAHLNSIPVKVGDEVPTGTIIGMSGTTGNSTGPHVHYEVRIKGQPVKPAISPDS